MKKDFSKKLLITGGAGFIGTNFVRHRLTHHPDERIVVLDALTYAGNLAGIEPFFSNNNFRFVHGNILDDTLLMVLLREEQIDTIVHFAAESHVDRAIHEPDAFIETNVIGTHTLLKAAKSVWLDSDFKASHRFHHISTDEVYGSLGPTDPPFSEKTPYAPNSPYSAAKAASDHLVRAYCHTYGLQVTMSNCSNNYGPYQFPEKLIPLTIVNILENREIPVYGEGLNIRDWLYVEDHCRAIELILNMGEVGEVYNIGGNNEWRNIDIVKRICRITDDKFRKDKSLSFRFPDAPPGRGIKAESLITFVKDRPGHDARYAIDPGKSKRELGYSPVESFDTGIVRTIEWMLDNELWWRSVMDGTYRKWIDLQYKNR